MAPFPCALTTLRPNSQSPRSIRAILPVRLFAGIWQPNVGLFVLSCTITISPVIGLEAVIGGPNAAVAVVYVPDKESGEVTVRYFSAPDEERSQRNMRIRPFVPSGMVEKSALFTLVSPTAPNCARPLTWSPPTPKLV